MGNFDLQITGLPLLRLVLIFALAPLLTGIVNRVKAFFAGRRGQSVLQLYYDLYKLLNKSAVYSRTATWVFRAGPLVGVAAVSAAAFMAPWGRERAVFAFNGDILAVIGLLALARFWTVLAALDTGSSFEGMGASREVWFALLAEPAFFLAFAALAANTGSFSLSGIYAAISPERWGSGAPLMALAAAAMFLVFLAENSRVPVDDPNTHLELTMIHEVMALDHSGPDLAFIFYASAVKFWVTGSFIVGIFTGFWRCGVFGGLALFAGGMFLLAGFTGVIESVMARMRMNKVPQMMTAAVVLSLLSMTCIFYR